MKEDKRIRLLISAYSCAPDQVSEPGVAWKQMAALIERKRYNITLLTRKKNVHLIESRLLPADRPYVSIIGVDLPRWSLWWKQGHLGMHVYYYIWQFIAYFSAKRLHKIGDFQVAHHLSFMSIRTNMVPFLGIPSVVGPVGGAQLPPPGFSKILRHPVKEAIRTFSIYCMRFSPLWRIFIHRTDVLVVANSSNLWIIPKKDRHKVIVRQLGWPTESTMKMALTEVKEQVEDTLETTNVVYIYWGGRFIGWKGLEILLRALPRLKKKYSNFKVDITGKGPDEKYYYKLVQDLNIESLVTFHGWINESEKNRLQSRADIYIFTSLHETTGTALFEMMALGKAIIAVNHAGPGEIVNNKCALLINTNGCVESSIDQCGIFIEKLFLDKNFRKKIGILAKNHLVTNYCWSDYIDKLEYEYKLLIKK